MLATESELGFRYWAFISYSHQDQTWARWLQRALETYRVPQRLIGQPIAAGIIPPRLTPVFRDRDELPTATDLGKTIDEALRQSWCLIVICSPAAAESRWVNEEVRAFQRLGHGDRIHCLVVDGAQDAVASSFPAALRARAQHDGMPGEPIAADVRRNGDGKAHARLQLVAGILGVNFDKLVQREQQRGYRRMALFASVAVFALAVLSAFTIATVRARHEADAQRAHAEGLVEFMLGDLRRRLEPEGRLATLDAVGKAALAYYKEQDPASLDADALARRARALHMIGDVYDQRGELDSALSVFKQAAASTAELLVRDGNNGQRIFDHAQSVYWVGLIAFQRGQIDVAEAAFKNYLALARRLVGIAPDNADWQAEVEYAHSNLGTLLFDQGRIDAAAEAFERALQVAQALALRTPDDPSRQSELAQSHAWLADVRVTQGRLQEAGTERRTELSIYQDMLARDPKNRDAKSASSIAERQLARIVFMRGDSALSLSQLRHAVDIADELIEEDPTNMVIVDMAAQAYADLGEGLMLDGKASAARAAINRSRDLAAQLVARDSSVVAWQSRLSRSQLLQAAFSAATGDALGALRLVQGVEQRLDALRQSHRLDRGARFQYARALLLSGDLHSVLGKPDQARSDREYLVQALHAETTTGPATDAMLAVALLKLGRTDEAAQIGAHLDAMGYRAPDYVEAITASSGPPDTTTDQATPETRR